MSKALVSATVNGDPQQFLCDPDTTLLDALRGTDVVMARVVDCWTSLFSPRAMAYRSQRGLAAEPAMAVVVQTMVDADRSGVMFTVDPATEERSHLATLSQSVLDAAPGCERVLSRAECDLLDACLDPEVPAERLAALSARRRRHGTPATLVPRDVRLIFAREAPLRLMTASVLARF